MEADTATDLVQIILFDLILSGDNAVVIGVVARRLHGRQRRLAIVFGAGGAVVLRIGFAVIATQLLELAIISAIGGVLLFWIGARLLKPEGDQEHREATSFREALQLIIMADVVMSLDNVLTVAGTAAGNVWLLVFGLGLSIPLLFVGAGLIAFVAERVPIIVYAGSALIFRVGVVLILEDPAIHERWAPNAFLEHGVPWIAAFAGPTLYVLSLLLRGRKALPILANPFGDRDEPRDETEPAQFKGPEHT